MPEQRNPYAPGWIDTDEQYAYWQRTFSGNVADVQWRVDQLIEQAAEPLLRVIAWAKGKE